jgi:F0F1-type ATP synthase membrane subunit c/vacuolar-type H+-ATPase subunit K
MQIGTGGGSAPAAGTAPQAHTVGDVLLGLADRVLSGAERVAGPLLAYRGQIRASETTERVAGINRDVSLNQSNNFLALGVAGINGTSATGIAGANALAAVATRPATPTTNVTGNTGPILIGGGNLNNGSLNPTNPTVICSPPTATSPGTCTK